MKLYNTLSGTIEEFKPITPMHVGMYHCGLTVYDRGHIGNFRTFVFNDILRRVFEYNGYHVKQVMNVTDVDDKTIRRSQQEKVTLEQLTRKYEAIFIEDSNNLNLLPPHQLIRATESIQDMIDLITVLMHKDIAYKSNDGIYFSIGKSKNYGQLARLSLEAITQERVTNDEYDKENPRDFALWKFYTPEDGDVVWEAPFGKGRPGWHIECSAMAINSLGPTIDIHTGGSDLIFPHHTNEIAQSEGATDVPFAHYWLHGAFMNVDDMKMSKSKNNFLTIADLNDNGISPIAYRYWLLTAHYRSQINFTKVAVSGAQNALIKIMGFIVDSPAGGNVRKDYKATFMEAINTDFNMPKALALAWELIHDPKITAADKRATLLDFDKVFGLGLDKLETPVAADIPLEVQALVDAREEVRLAKDFAKSDALRKEIEARGFTVKDTPEGPVVKSVLEHSHSHSHDSHEGHNH